MFGALATKTVHGCAERQARDGFEIYSSWGDDGVVTAVAPGGMTNTGETFWE